MSKNDDGQKDTRHTTIEQVEERAEMEAALGEKFTQAYEAFDKAADALAEIVNGIEDNNDLSMSFLQFVSENLATRAGYIAGLAATELGAPPARVYGSLQGRLLSGIYKAVLVHTDNCGSKDCAAVQPTVQFLNVTHAAIDRLGSIMREAQRGQSKQILH